MELVNVHKWQLRYLGDSDLSRESWPLMLFQFLVMILINNTQVPSQSQSKLYLFALLWKLVLRQYIVCSNTLLFSFITLFHCVSLQGCQMNEFPQNTFVQPSSIKSFRELQKALARVPGQYESALNKKVEMSKFGVSDLTKHI